MTSEIELLSFETSNECDWITIELEDNNIISVKPYIAQIARVGNDPNTGAPIYAVGTSYQLRYVSLTPSLKKISQPEFVKFKADKECQWLEVKIEDGSVLKVKPGIVYVMRMAFDPMGVPQYLIQIQAAIQISRVPKELIKKPVGRVAMHT
ncbi:MAG: hypothetical protein ABWJ42_00705 [Sulfolobales archaeon]